MYDNALPLGFAQAVPEPYFEKVESRDLIDKTASWRDRPMTGRQKQLLDKYRVAHDPSWTKGMAPDELGRRFARKRVKQFKAQWDPAKVRQWLADPAIRARYERRLDVLKEA